MGYLRFEPIESALITYFTVWFRSFAKLRFAAITGSHVVLSFI
jgi:hypothetical protein